MLNVLLLGIALSSSTADARPDSPKVLTAPEFEAIVTDLTKQAGADARGLAIRYLRQEPASAVLIVARVHTGEAEEHQLWTDEIFVRQGEIELITGGEMKDRHPTGPAGEFRGSALTGRTTSRRLHPGDIVEIPAGMLHWMKVVGQGPTVTFVSKLR